MDSSVCTQCVWTHFSSVSVSSTTWQVSLEGLIKLSTFQVSCCLGLSLILNCMIMVCHTWTFHYSFKITVCGLIWKLLLLGVKLLPVGAFACLLFDFLSLFVSFCLFSHFSQLTTSSSPSHRPYNTTFFFFFNLGFKTFSVPSINTYKYTHTHNKVKTWSAMTVQLQGLTICPQLFMRFCGRARLKIHLRLLLSNRTMKTSSWDKSRFSRRMQLKKTRSFVGKDCLFFTEFLIIIVKDYFKW